MKGPGRQAVRIRDMLYGGHPAGSHSPNRKTYIFKEVHVYDA